MIDGCAEAKLAVAVGLSVLYLSAGRSHAALDVVETWEGGTTAGWTLESGQATLTNPGGYLDFAYDKQSAPFSSSDVAKISVAPGYLLTHLALRFNAFDIAPSSARVCMHSSVSGNMWYVPLYDIVAGNWLQYDVPVDFAAAKWTMGPASSEAQFNEDIKSIDWVGLYVRRHSSPYAQDYGVDDFAIQGDDLPAESDADIDGMPDAWEIANGLDELDPVDADFDADSDLMTNLEEYLAGTDPNDPESYLGMRVTQVDRGDGTEAIMIIWDSVADKVYSLFRANSLVGAFVEVQAGIPATAPENQVEDVTATDRGPYFYRVKLEQ